MPYTLRASLALFIATLTLLFGATFALTTPAHAAGVCDMYRAGIAIPTSYGAAYNVYSTSQMLLTAFCNDDDSVTVTAGKTDGDLTYVYKNGYYYTNGAWHIYTYSCSEMLGGAWCPGKVTKTLIGLPTSGTVYLASYTCQWINYAWKCGCRDTSCATNYWQLQAWRVQSSGGGIVPSNAKILFEQDFDDVPKLTSARWMEDEESKIFFDDSYTTVTRNGPSEQIQLSPDPSGGNRGNSIKIFHPKGTCGVTFSSGPDELDRLEKEMYMSYDMYLDSDYRFENGYNFFGGKFGLRTRREKRHYDPITGELSYGTPEDYTFGALNISSDQAWGRGDFTTATYYYTEERWRRGDFWNDSDPVNFQNQHDDDTHQSRTPLGRWFNVTSRVKMNTFDGGGVGRHDGVTEVWLDGKLVVTKSDIRFSVSDNPGGFKFIYLMSQYGGPCIDKYRSPQDQAEYYDNLVFWTE